MYTSSLRVQGWIYIDIMDGRLLLDPIFFVFMQFLGKFGRIIGLAPPPGKSWILLEVCSCVIWRNVMTSVQIRNHSVGCVPPTFVVWGWGEGGRVPGRYTLSHRYPTPSDTLPPWDTLPPGYPIPWIPYLTGSTLEGRWDQRYPTHQKVHGTRHTLPPLERPLDQGLGRDLAPKIPYPRSVKTDASSPQLRCREVITQKQLAGSWQRLNRSTTTPGLTCFLFVFLFFGNQFCWNWYFSNRECDWIRVHNIILFHDFWLAVGRQWVEIWMAVRYQVIWNEK